MCSYAPVTLIWGGKERFIDDKNEHDVKVPAADGSLKVFKAIIEDDHELRQAVTERLV